MDGIISGNRPRELKAGQRVRFWAAPDEPGPARRVIWQALLDAGVTTSTPTTWKVCRQFLLANDPQPSEPYID